MLVHGRHAPIVGASRRCRGEKLFPLGQVQSAVTGGGCRVASEAAFIAAGRYGFRESMTRPSVKTPLQVLEPEYVPVIVLSFI